MTDLRAKLLARIAGDERPTATSAPICLDLAAVKAHEAAKEAHNAAALAAPTREDGKPSGKLSGDPVAKARKALDEAAQAVRDSSVQVVLQALPEAEWKAFVAAHMKLTEDQRSDDTFAISRCFLRVETLDGEDTGITRDELLDLLPHLSAGEVGTLGVTAVQVNQGRPDVPSSALR